MASSGLVDDYASLHGSLTQVTVQPVNRLYVRITLVEKNLELFDCYESAIETCLYYILEFDDRYPKLSAQLYL